MRGAISRERPTGEDSSEEPIGGGNGVTVKGRAPRNKTETLKCGERNQEETRTQDSNEDVKEVVENEKTNSTNKGINNDRN